MNSFFLLLECENDPSKESIDLSDMIDVMSKYWFRRLSQIKHLKSIDLSMSHLSDLSFLDVMNVHTLDLSNCSFESLNISLPNIKNLNLAYNNLEELLFLQSYPSLESLNISESEKKDFDHSPLITLTQLTELKMEDHIIEDFSFLESMPQLTSLDISSCIFEDPCPLFALPNLKSLKINEVPEDFPWEKLNGLESLDIYVEDVRCLKGLENLKSLTTLRLDLDDDLHFKASDFNFLSQLPNLRALSCKGIDLSDIEIPSLKKLEIDHLTNLATIQHLTSLEYLSFKNGWVLDISPIESLYSLHTCIFQRCQIKDISPLANLPHLVTLDLDQNLIDATNNLPPNAFPKLRSLVLSNNKLQEFSLNIPTLEVLNLSNNNLTSFESFKSLSFPKLTQLDLKNNPIEADQLILEHILPSLVSLCLNECGITKCSIKGLKKLEDLALNANNISELTLADLPHLQYLYLSNNALVDLSGIAAPFLTDLYLCNNPIKLSTLPTLKNLWYLDVSDCHLTEDKMGDLRRFESLKILDARTNQLSKVPQSDAMVAVYLQENNIVSVNNDLNIPSLEIINLEYNPLKRFVMNQGLPRLQSLSTNQENLEEFALEHCTMIEEMYILYAKLRKITLHNLPNLQTLILPTIDQSCLQNLQQIKSLKELRFECGEIEHLQLSDMPVLECLYIKNVLPKCSLDNLPNLKELDLSFGKLKTLPRLDGFRKLTKLRLIDNQLKAVDIQHMPKLSRIDIRNNQLSKFRISNLPKLQYLNLHNNQLTNIEGLQDLPSLDKLNLSHNQISSIANIGTFLSLEIVNILKNKITDFCPLLRLHHLEYVLMDTTDQDEFVKGLQKHPMKDNLDIDFEHNLAFTPPLWYLYFEDDFSLFIKMEDFSEYPYARQIYDLIRGGQKELALSMAESQGWPLDVYLRYEYYWLYA